jgi:hypothetical protein
VIAGSDYKRLLNNLISSRYGGPLAGYILSRITAQYTSGEWGELRRLAASGDSPAIHQLLDMLVEKNAWREYSASIIPTVLSSSVARSMKMLGGEAPSPESIYYWLYLQLSGIPVQDKIVNIIGVDDNSKTSFTSMLIDEEALKDGKIRIRTDELRKPLGPGGRSFPLDYEFCTAFTIINYFCYWLKAERKQLEDLGLSDLSTLVVITIPMRGGRRRSFEVKRSMHFIPRLASFITRWYGEYLSSDREYPPLGRFIASLHTQDDISGHALNKFLYDFLNHRIAGQLLLKLIIARTDSILQSHAPRIAEAGYFFQKLSSEVFK